jgi:4'-phosphopantetheinyl transferase
VAARALGLRPGDITLDRTCAQCGKPHGKPRLTASVLDAADGDLELSVSHSGDRVAVAAFRGAPVGVVVEDANGRTRGAEDQEALERYVLSDDEIAAYPDGADGGNPEERLRNFLVLWTRKEAVTKATGDGLRVPFREVIVSPPGHKPAVVAWPYPDPPAGVSLFDLDGDTGPGPRLRRRPCRHRPVRRGRLAGRDCSPRTGSQPVALHVGGDICASACSSRA